MCTVTYIPIETGKFILTSNRDEHIVRPTNSPIKESINGTNVFFPRDEQAGGTWIAAGDNGRVCCLLNGAFEKHKRKELYSKSRGKIVLEAFEFDNLSEFFHNVALDDVEPFTLIVVDNSEQSKLYEFRWDGNKRHLIELDILIPKIWSSATLYSKQVRDERELWFGDWLSKQNLLKGDVVLNFHSFPHGNDTENDVIMDRNNGLKTVSITQIECNVDSFKMEYHDLVKQQKITLTKEIKRNSYA